MAFRVRESCSLTARTATPAGEDFLLSRDVPLGPATECRLSAKGRTNLYGYDRDLAVPSPQKMERHLERRIISTERVEGLAGKLGLAFQPFARVLPVPDPPATAV